MTGRQGGRPSSPRPRARWRVIAVRICIAVNFALLLLLVIFPPLAHHAMARGLGVAASATVGIVCGLLYLRSRR